MNKMQELSPKNLTEHDRTLLERLIKQCDPSDILLSSFTNLAQISDGESSILSAIHRNFNAESETMKDFTLHQLKRLVARTISSRAVEGNHPIVPSDSSVSQPIQRTEEAYEEGVDSVNFEIVNLTSEQIEAYDLTHEVTAEEIFGEIETPFSIDCDEQSEKQVVVSSAPLQSVSLPIQV